MTPPFIAAIVQLCITCAVFFCPVQKRSCTRSPCAAAPELRVDAELHDKALAVLRVEDHRHSKADVLSVPLKKQKEAAVLRPAVNFHHVLMIFQAKKVFQFFLVGIRKDIPLVIGMQPLPKGSNIVFCDRFTDGDLVFHFVSSKILFGGLGSVNPPHTIHLHKNHTFLKCIICIQMPFAAWIP